MLNLEFHSHTIYSKDSLTTPKKMLETCLRKGIDRIIVTDHNSLQGARAAHLIDPQRVIIGEEIMTTQGELLAAFVQEEVPAGLTPHEAIECLKNQNAFISVSHPFDTFRAAHWKREELEAIVPYIDAIEVFNSRCMGPEPNLLAKGFASQHGLPGTVGSDAHAAFELGRARMIIPDFNSSDELRLVIRRARFDTSLSSPLVHLYSRYAVWYKKVFPNLLTKY